MKSVFDAYRKQWEQAFDRKDPAAIAELYTENGVIYAADGSVARGREAIRAHFERVFAEFEKLVPGVRFHFETKLEDEEIFGETGYEFGSYRLTTPQGKVLVEGNFSGIGRHLGEVWKISRHMMTEHRLTPAPERKLATV